MTAIQPRPWIADPMARRRAAEHPDRGDPLHPVQVRAAAVGQGAEQPALAGSTPIELLPAANAGRSAAQMASSPVQWQ